MDDLISRQEAISAVNTALFPKKNTAKDAEKALLNLPPAQQWTPVSERPPEVTGRYIVTNTMTGAWEIDIDMWLGEWRDSKGVVAWMELPESFAGGDDV